MKAHTIFEKVNLIYPVEQRRFFNLLNDTLIELAGLYGDVPKLLYTGEKELEAVTSLDYEIGILPLYQNAVVDNILFFLSKEENYKNEFLRKSQAAYLKYWNTNAKGRKMKNWEKGGASNV